MRYFTVEAVRLGKVTVFCKNKTRTILVPRQLQKILVAYTKKIGIKSGSIFITKSGKPLNRSNVWAEMKGLCKKAGVLPEKVFPHNLRKLFTRTFYRIEKDIAQLSDILGHSNINITRIYIVSSGAEHRKRWSGWDLSYKTSKRCVHTQSEICHCMTADGTKNYQPAQTGRG